MIVKHMRCANTQTYEYWLEQKSETGSGKTFRSESIWLTRAPGRDPEVLYGKAFAILVERALNHPALAESRVP